MLLISVNCADINFAVQKNICLLNGVEKGSKL